MKFPISFEGRIRPLPYVLWSLGLFFSQHLAVLIALKAQGAPLSLDRWFFVLPLRSLVTHAQASELTLILAFAYLLIVAWALAVLAFRRAADANISEWIAAAAMVPIIQIAVIGILAVRPHRVASDKDSDSAARRVAPSHGAGPDSPAADHGDAPDSDWVAAVHGVAAGVGLTLSAVAVGALLFGVYGYGVFVVSPFVIGATTAYFANRRVDIGFKRTAQLVAGATALGGIALVAVALEGIICIILAAPLGFGASFLGGLLGRSIALLGRRPARQALSGIALLPVVFALEKVLPASTEFSTAQRIDVNAPPDVVWRSILHMNRIEEPPGLPFRLGVAHPLHGEVLGEGVGAIRRGEFSTGTTIERVTEWVPNRKLAFVVVNDVPAMRELSPYEHVHAPHVVGYFRTSYTSFELVQDPGGGTQIIERTSHELKLDPVLYWLPLARWVVHENNARVLAHIRHQAEQSFRMSGDQ